MSSSLIFIIVFFGFFALLIWLSIRQQNKESKEPLSIELKNHYFVKTILDITDMIKNLKEESEIELFLQKQVGTEDNRPITKSTPYSDYNTVSMVGASFGMVGALLTSGSTKIKFKIERIDAIQFLWFYSLFSKISKDNMSKEEKQKIEKDIKEKLALVLNSKVLSLTKQNDTKDAWMTILKDKLLTNKTLNQLWGEVRRTLFPGRFI